MSTARQIYRDEASRVERDQMVLDHLWLVHRIVRRLAHELPTGIDRENLKSAGILGLMQAANQFDPSRSIEFRTFAAKRIRGEVLDELRRNSPLPQRILQHLAMIRRVAENLGPDATRETIAAAAGLTLEEYDEAIQATRVANARTSDDQDVWIQSLFERSDERPEMPLEREEMKRLLVEAILRLSEQERLIITLYYYEELTLKEIGDVVGLSESRVSRVLTQARLQLKHWIQERLG